MKDCASCEYTSVLWDFDDPEYLMYHCYHPKCPCGCHTRKAKAMDDARSFFSSYNCYEKAMTNNRYEYLVLSVTEENRRTNT